MNYEDLESIEEQINVKFRVNMKKTRGSRELDST